MAIVLDIQRVKSWFTGVDVQPRCNNHQPKAELITEADGSIVQIHCDNCGLTGWMHPEAYAQLITEVKETYTTK